MDLSILSEALFHKTLVYYTHMKDAANPCIK